MEHGWFMISKSRGKMKCLTCHMATVMFFQPMKVKPIDYNHTTELSGLTLENKVDAYFYYDLTRALLQTVGELMSKQMWPELTFPKCGQSSALALTTEQINERKSMRLARELSYEGHFGLFGRFIFDNYAFGSVYQDTVMKMSKVNLWIDQPYRIMREAEWTFGEPYGRLMAITAQEEGVKGNLPAVVGTTTVFKKKLKVVMILQPPFIMKRYNASWPNNIEYYGYCIDLLNAVQLKMRSPNISEPWEWDYELYEVADGRFGEKRADGSWTGVIGELAEKRADMGLGPVSVMAERETVVDFTVPYYDLVGINILMKKSAVPSHLFKFLTVLENDVWFSILGSFVIVSIVIYLYDRLSPYSYYNNKADWGPDDPPRRDFNFKECLWFSMTSLTPQGGGEAPINLSGRIAAGTWWLFGFIVIASYTANLAAFLTVSRLDSPIESLEHLSNQFRIRYAPQVATQSLVYFERMSFIEKKFYEIWKDMALNATRYDAVERAKYAVWDYPISDKYTKMLAQMYQAGMPASYEEGVWRTKSSRSAQEGFAFVAEATQCKFAILTNCDLTTIGNEFSRKPMALVVQQNSTLKDRLSSAILKLLNERKLEEMKEFWWDKYRKTCEDTKKSSDGISIHNIGGVFIVIFIGVVLACITLVFEYLFLKRKKRVTEVQVQNVGGGPGGINAYSSVFRGGGGGDVATTGANGGLSGLSGAPNLAPGTRPFNEM